MKTKTIILLCIFAFIFGSCNPRTTTENNQTTDRITAIYCENRNEIRSFLVKYSVLRDVNPTHQEDSDYVSAFVRKVFERQYTDDQIPDLITQALQLFYNNSVSIFEDSPDIRRWTIRRSMSSMALAFLADDWRYPAFLNDARTTLHGIEDFANSQMLLMVNLIEIYKELEFGFPIAHRIPTFQEFLNSRKEYIYTENFFAEYNQILLNIKTNSR